MVKNRFNSSSASYREIIGYTAFFMPALIISLEGKHFKPDLQRDGFRWGIPAPNTLHE